MQNSAQQNFYHKYSSNLFRRFTSRDTFSVSYSRADLHLSVRTYLSLPTLIIHFISSKKEIAPRLYFRECIWHIIESNWACVEVNEPSLFIISVIVFIIGYFWSVLFCFTYLLTYLYFLHFIFIVQLSVTYHSPPYGRGEGMIIGEQMNYHNDNWMIIGW